MQQNVVKFLFIEESNCSSSFQCERKRSVSVYWMMVLNTKENHNSLVEWKIYLEPSLEKLVFLGRRSFLFVRCLVWFHMFHWRLRVQASARHAYSVCHSISYQTQFVVSCLPYPLSFKVRLAHAVPGLRIVQFPLGSHIRELQVSSPLHTQPIPKLQALRTYLEIIQSLRVKPERSFTW